MLPSHLPSVIEEVFDCPLSDISTAIPQVHLLQELVAPEEVTLDMIPANAIPSALVSAPDPDEPPHTG